MQHCTHPAIYLTKTPDTAFANAVYFFPACTVDEKYIFMFVFPYCVSLELRLGFPPKLWMIFLHTCKKQQTTNKKQHTLWSLYMTGLKFSWNSKLPSGSPPELKPSSSHIRLPLHFRSWNPICWLYLILITSSLHLLLKVIYIRYPVSVFSLGEIYAGKDVKAVQFAMDAD